MKGAKARRRIVTLNTQEDTIPGSSFDMRQLEEAASSIGDSFPIISWVFDDNISKAPDHGHHHVIAAGQKNDLFLYMSPQERRLKRRRRGSTSGYLVRSLEAQSLLQFDLSKAIQRKEADVQKQRQSRKRLIQQVGMETTDDLYISLKPQISEELC